MMEQAVLQLLDPEFRKDSPPGNISGFWCWKETERLCVTEKEASQGERAGTENEKHRGCCPHHLVRERAQVELHMNWAGSTGGRTEQELHLFHAK